MRNLRYYLISLAIHAVVLGPLAYVLFWGTFTPPHYSLRLGGGSGMDGAADGDAVVLEGEFLPCSQTELRINPPPATHSATVRSELSEAQNTELGRLVTPSVELAQIARPVEWPIPAPPPAPPPLPAAKMASRIAEQAEVPPPSLPEQRHDSADVDVGELLKGSAGSQAVLSSADGLSDSHNGTLQPGGRSSGGGGLDGLPTALNANVRPLYPLQAKARGIEGEVVLRVTIDENGAVRSAKVETSSGDASLDLSALTTVRDQWRFEPARRNGMPVECEVLVPVRFRMRASG